MVEFAVYDRTRLAPGDELTGPVLIDEGTATTVVHSGQHVAVEEHGYLLVTAVAEDLTMHDVHERRPAGLRTGR